MCNIYIIILLIYVHAYIYILHQSVDEIMFDYFVFLTGLPYLITSVTFDQNAHETAGNISK
jgi:hypothetical protein